MSKQLVHQSHLRRFAVDALVKAGLDPERADIAVEPLLYADRKGFDTHGIANLARIYVRKLLNGHIRANFTTRIVTDFGATSLIDGDDGLGLVIGVQAMRRAIAKAAEFGVGITVVRRSSHFGSAGYYSELAVAHGMIGISMSNLGAQTIARPPNGRVKLVGTNPISCAAPAGHMPAFSLDMSTTVVSTGKIRAAARRGERIPEGWLIDDSGEAVTDPNAYDDGTGHIQLLGGKPETGGFKGLGLALLVDILCGALTGAAVGPDPELFGPAGEKRMRDDHDVGHFFLAIDVARFGLLAEFQQRMDRMLGTVVACPDTGGGRRVTYPGYLEEEQRRTGDRQAVQVVAVDSAVLADLAELAQKLCIAPLLLQTEVSA